MWIGGLSVTFSWRFQIVLPSCERSLIHTLMMWGLKMLNLLFFCTWMTLQFFSCHTILKSFHKARVRLYKIWHYVHMTTCRDYRFIVTYATFQGHSWWSALYTSVTLPVSNLNPCVSQRQLMLLLQSLPLFTSCFCSQIIACCVSKLATLLLRLIRHPSFFTFSS